MQGMEYEQQVIGAYCGVLGEEGEEGEESGNEAGSFTVSDGGSPDTATNPDE